MIAWLHGLRIMGGAYMTGVESDCFDTPQLGITTAFISFLVAVVGVA